MDQKDVIISLINGVQSADGNIRKTSEQSLDDALRANLDQFVLALIAIGSQDETGITLKQSALLLLKNAILRFWHIGMDSFEGPLISPDVKAQVRLSLVNLIGGHQRKVRSVAALLLSKIASVEYPDEWPNLVDEVLDLAQHGQPDQVHGALTVLKELLRESISAEEFFKIGEKITSTLLDVASNASYSYSARSSAVECFSSCVQFFLMSDDTTNFIDDIIDKILREWTSLFAQILAIPITNPGHASLIGLKLEVITCIRDMEAGFPRLVVYLVDLFSAVWTDLCRIEEMHTKIYVRQSITDIQPETEDDVELMNDCTIEALVVSEMSFFGLCLESSNKQILDEFKNDVALIQRFVALCIELGQMPVESPLAGDNVNEFVTEETGLSIDHTTRSELANVICLLNNENLPIALWEQIRVIFEQSSKCDSLVKESCLYLFGQAITGGVPSFSRLPQHAVDGMMDITLSILHSDTTDLLLLSRAIILGSDLCVAFEKFIKPEVMVKYVWKAIGFGQSGSPTLRVASLIGINKIQIVDRDDVKPHQRELFQTVASLVNIAAEDTPSFLVEVLLLVARLDFDVSARSSEIIELLFTLASKDTANLELNTETTEVFEDIVENATKMNLYSQVCSNTLPLLMRALESMQNYEYNSGIVLAIGLVGGLIDKGPSPLPTEVLDLCFRPLYQVLMNAEDTQLLQAASETFTYLVEHAPEQLKAYRADSATGPDLVLNVASRLLDPRSEDSATINSGSLINTIIKIFGNDLGPVLERILEAAARRLQIAENLLLVESLVSVFCQLTLNAPKELVDVLWTIQLEDTTALDVVLTKWLGCYEVIRGSEAIKKNTVALQTLYMLNDDRVKSIIVDGDIIPPEGDVIITRSKAQTVRRTRLPAHAMIVKLMARELSNTPVDETRVSLQDAVQTLAEEEWEDIEKPDFEPGLNLAGPRQTDTETYELTVAWFKRIVKEHVGDIERIYTENLTQFEKDLIRSHCQLD